MSEKEIRENVIQFLQVNFPQIKMHGGNATVTNVDLENDSVSVNLSGACSGCGISPMTVQAIKNRLPKDIPAVSTVHVETGEVDPTNSVDVEEGEVPF